MKTLQRTLLVCYLIVSVCFLPVRSNGFTIGEEREVGEKLLYTVRSSFEVLDDPDLKQYIEKLGEEVIKVAGVQFFDYHFFVLKSKDFNAFAAPSGLIFFNSGLIEKVDSENELVSVIAHEIGHIVKRHISSRIGKGKKISLATMGLVLAALALGGGAATEALLAGSMAAGQSAALHFSRLDEEEADLLAYDWMKKMERHPDGQVKMLQTMRQIARYRSSMMPQYLLTHPNPEARLDYVQTLVSSDKKEIEGFNRGNNFDFLRFKYRIMAETKDSFYLREYCSSVLSSSRADELEIIMAKYGLAQLDRIENNYASSLKLIEEVINTIGQKNVLLVDRGIIEFESGNTEKAYTTLSAAYKNDRSNMYAAHSLAGVAFQMGLLEEAEKLYKDVIAEIPEYDKAYFNLGKLSATRGKSAETKYYLGKYDLLHGKLELSRKNLETAISEGNLEDEQQLDAEQTLDLIKRLEK
ncbi:beta-barrel assembly-enhancing protease [Desulfopila inferna]|uniref:beta-barrel assembly-enhancing protease n=1 Tax=Desulfopila inferna TaxID=468528 RepID=UPI0019629BB9|nr:M48 family metallopeptidase [Desulfopila inferna]MBM9602916.1 M48 family metalloprotease [Desulfopila inferna]